MPFGIIGWMGPGMRQVVGFGDRFTGMGTFGSEFGARHCNQWDFTAYVCESAATRPSSQITLGRLVIIEPASRECDVLTTRPPSHLGISIVRNLPWEVLLLVTPVLLLSPTTLSATHNDYRRHPNSLLCIEIMTAILSVLQAPHKTFFGIFPGLPV